MHTRMFRTIQKPLAAITIFLTIFSTIPLAPARAQFAVTAPYLETIASLQLKAMGVTTSNSIWEKIKTIGLDSIAVAAAQRVTVNLSRKAINSLTGGASGAEDANIIDDFGQYFQNLRNEQTSIYYQSLLASDNPNAQSLALKLAGSIQSGRTPKIGEFTLGEVVSPVGTAQEKNAKAKAFMDGDFSQGGINAWNSLFLNANNSPVSFALNTAAQYGNRVEQERRDREIQLTSPGIAPKQVCGLSLEKKSPNGMTDAQAAAAAAQTAAAQQSNQVIVVGTNGNVSNLSQQQAAQAQTQAGASGNQAAGNTDPVWDPGTAALDTLNELCDVQVTKLPLAFAQKYGEQAIGAAFDRLAQVDEMEDMIGSALGDLVSWGISKGIQALRGNNNYVPAVSGPNMPAGSGGLNVVDFTSGVEVALNKTQQELEILQQASVEFAKYPPAFAAMDRCLPGPDKGFTERFNDFITDGSARVQEVSDNDSDRGERAAYALAEVQGSSRMAIQQTGSDIRNTKFNLPGAGAMLQEQDSFDAQIGAYQELKQMMSMKTAASLGISQAVNRARSVGSGAFNDVANPVYTYADWEPLSPAQKDAIYQAAASTPGIVENSEAEVSDESLGTINVSGLGTVTESLQLPGNLPAVTSTTQFNALPQNVQLQTYLLANGVSPNQAVVASTDPTDQTLPLNVSALVQTYQANPGVAGPVAIAYTEDYKKFLATLRFTWSRWEKFGTTTDSSGQTIVQNTELAKQKNEIRRAFLSYQSGLSTDESIGEAKVLLLKIQEKNTRIADLTYDCRLLKFTIMKDYWSHPFYNFYGNTGTQIKEKLTQRIQSGNLVFKTQDFKQDIVSGQSNILSFDCRTDGRPAGPGMNINIGTYETPTPECVNTIANNGVANLALGDANTRRARYQLPPTRSVQELIVRDFFKSAFCRYTEDMGIYNFGVTAAQDPKQQPGIRFLCPARGHVWVNELAPPDTEVLPPLGFDSDEMRQNPNLFANSSARSYLQIFMSLPYNIPVASDFMTNIVNIGGTLNNTGYDYAGAGGNTLSIGTGNFFHNQFGRSATPHLNWYILTNADAATQFFQDF